MSNHSRPGRDASAVGDETPRGAIFIVSIVGLAIALVYLSIFALVLSRA